jgi:hypothetical protein
MLSEIYKELEGSNTVYDFADAVVKVRLKGTRDMYLEEIERLENMEKLSEWQKQDYADLSGDVIAITRVMNFYGFEEKENEDE